MTLDSDETVNDLMRLRSRRINSLENHRLLAPYSTENGDRPCTAKELSRYRQSPCLRVTVCWFRCKASTTNCLAFNISTVHCPYSTGLRRRYGRVPSLLDREGYFFSDVKTFMQSAIPDEVEIEMRSQIEFALSRGLRPSHADCHMFALYRDVHLTALFGRVAADYGLRYLLPSEGALHYADDCKYRVLPRLFQLNTPLEEHEAMPWYLHIIDGLADGLNQLIVHLGYSNAELQAITADRIPWGARWRQQDFDTLSNPRFVDAIKAHGVALVDWNSIIW